MYIAQRRITHDYHTYENHTYIIKRGVHELTSFFYKHFSWQTQVRMTQQ